MISRGRMFMAALIAVGLAGLAVAELPYDAIISYDVPVLESGIVVTTSSEDVVVDYDGYRDTVVYNSDGTSSLYVPSVDELSREGNEIESYLLYDREDPSLLGDYADFDIMVDGQTINGEDILSMTVTKDDMGTFSMDDTVVIILTP